MLYKVILKAVFTVSLMSLLIVFGSVVNSYEVKADTEQVQTVQESNNLPSTEEEIEKEYDITSPIIISNFTELKECIKTEPREVNVGDLIMTVIK